MHDVRRRLRFGGTLLAWVGLMGTIGCVSLNSFQTANTLGEGDFQFAVEPSMLVAAAPGGPGFVPRVDLSARYGVSERVDIGARIGLQGVEFQSKFQLTPAGENGFVASIAPNIGGFFAGAGGAGGGVLHLQVPVLLGIGIGDGSQLVFGPRLINWTLFGGGQGGSGIGNILYAGTTVGISLRLGEKFRLMPEVGFVYPIVSSVAVSGNSMTNLFGNFAGFQFGLGLLFGG